jgi:hypothetical protein
VKEISPTQDATLARAAMRVIGALLGAARPAAGGSAVALEVCAASGCSDAGRDVDGERDGLVGCDEDAGVCSALLESMDEAARAQLAEAAAVFGVVWGVGGTADAEGRAAFDAFLR